MDNLLGVLSTKRLDRTDTRLLNNIAHELRRINNCQFVWLYKSLSDDSKRDLMYIVKETFARVGQPFELRRFESLVS